MASRQRFWFAATLLLITLAAFALRLYRLDAQSLWYDEGVTAIVAQYDPATLIRWTADDIQPPLYYLLVSGWGRLAGWSEWSLRFPSLVFGVLLVPLLAALARTLTRSRGAALLAALITALHPLLVYYSQEARMYTMLAALGVLAGYCLIRSIQTPAPQRAWWIAYTLAATAAVYTHYFALFLLLALMLAYLLDLLLISRRSLAPAPLIANGVLFLCFLPWLGILMTRFQVDSSYWEGAFKLWEALRSVAIRFSLGETVLEAEATALIPLYGAITLCALLMLGIGAWQTQDVHRKDRLRALHYALFWLCVPTVAVLGLASLTPKFTPRYVLMALPGLILIWSAGLGSGVTGWRMPRFALRSPVVTFLRLIGILLLCAGFLYANANWFTDLAFTKAQWRELAAYIRQHRQSGEAVILVSGHAWPVWRYYAPEIEPIRLPQNEILDVDAVLDFANTTEPLHTRLADAEGAWLVGWQDEVVDPMGIVPLQLQRNGLEVPVGSRFWGVDLRYFQGVDAAAIEALPPLDYPVSANFANTVQLLGYSVAANGDLVLFWELKVDATAQDLYMTGETTTAGGLPYTELEDRRLAAYTYPTFRWRSGQVAAGQIPAQDWAGAGAVPGNYRLYVGVYDPAGDPAGLDLIDANGVPQGKRTVLEIYLPIPTPAVMPDNLRSWHELAPGIFASASIDLETAAPGQQILVSMAWWTARSLGGRHLDVAWRQGDRIVPGEPIEIAPAFPTVEWQGERLMRTRHAVHPPVGLPPGYYELVLALAGADAMSIPILIQPSAARFDLPDRALVLAANFGEQLELSGIIELLPASMAPGEPLPLTLVWRALAEVGIDASVTVQWLDAGGRPARQVDERLPGGASTWLPAQVVTQPLTLTAPEAPGVYRLILAVYDAEAAGFPRLSLPDGGDALELGLVEIH